jgi:hypothetical protein
MNWGRASAHYHGGQGQHPCSDRRRDGGPSLP